ncbi:unnamed protein product [Chilo suppressalis]|uniref:Coiled-coil domain-containing protein 186 n=1 Tax=Chilo suppressalis TaxID=168631 RepID=A0ABN8B3W6_CHISP|nr:unnamed protein product [Chilo suppressalis]
MVKASAMTAFNMDIRSNDTLNHIDCVDVNNESKENGSVCDLTSDSGVSTYNSCSNEYAASTDCETSPTKSTENAENCSNSDCVKNETNSFSSPISLSSDVDELTDNISAEKRLSLTENTCSQSENSPTKDKSEICHSIANQSESVILEPGLLNDRLTTAPCYSNNITDYVNNISLASSTTSLNEQAMHSINNSVISKSPYSKSAENISTIEQNVIEKKLSSNEINADEILTEFANKKSKVAATQNVPELSQANVQANVDVRFSRLPKELIPQDLGSIVKNVHGIFSTVSGSLKNAYNNSHRMSMQKTLPKAIPKPIPNGKVMNYIFEEEPCEERQMEKNYSMDNLNSSDNSETMNKEVKGDSDNKEVEGDSKTDMLKMQVESLEQLLAEQRKENATLRERVKQHLDELQEKDHMFKDIENKLDLMSKRVEQAEREKDAAVMRYASVECMAIEAKRAAEKAANAEKAALTEVELLNSKLKSAHGEKHRICQLYDDKCHELANSEREVFKVREEIKELEGRLKWTQSKLRMEMDAYKESAERAEKLSQQVSELEAARDSAAAHAGDSAKVKQLESDLKECQAALILCRHEKQDLDKQLSSLSHQLDACTRERDSNTAALLAATAEVEQLKASNLRLEEEAAELAALRAQAALADTLSAQLQRETDRCSRLESSLSSARAQAETCARREAAALEHAARLTAAHVTHQATQHNQHDKVQALTADNVSLRERVTALEEERCKLQAALTEETDRRNKENKVLARKVAELTEEVADANKKIEWEKGENGVLKKKHASAIKELNRELQRALKRCEQLESKLPPPDAPSTRTGSVTSLSSVESAPHEERLTNGHVESVPDIQVREPDKQALIERIVSLQRAAARRADRCEFLEEHSRQLTGELRAKSKLLRHLLCSMPAGAVASQDRDANKKEIARLGGGAMAAVWGGDPTGMTLELSLEMNKRLQAVLEDALLKNITLKENMDTLGAEISRLKEQQKANDTSKAN